MPTLSPLTWIAEQNTKLSADTHLLSYRVILTTANTSQTLNIPTSQTNPAQATFPGIAPTGEPQQGRRMFVTKLVVRDANGAIGGTAGGGVSLVDVTQSNAVVATSGAITTTAPYFVAPVTSGTVAVNPGDQLAVQYTAPTSGTATATGMTVDVFGYFQQGI